MLANADRNLRTVARSAMQFRNILSGFGVVFSVRAFSNWVKDALEVEKLTKSQAKSIGDAGRAMGQLNAEFQNLARTAATELAPALEHAAKFWKEIFFPSGSQFGSAADALRPQVDAAVAEVERLQRLLNTQTVGDANANWFQRLLFGTHEDNIAETTQQLAAARAELERLRSVWTSLQGKPQEFNDGLQEMTAGIKMPAELRQFDFAAANAMVLDGALKEVSATIAKMPDDLKKLSPEFNTFAAALREPLKDIESESLKAARFVADSFRDAFTGWLLDGEMKFKDFLRRMAIEIGASALFNFLGSAFPGVPLLGKLFGGSRANGGPVRAGMLYKVHANEAFFTPGSDGHVGKSGGGGITIHVDARGATDPGAVEAAAYRGGMAAFQASREYTDSRLRALSRPSMA